MAITLPTAPITRDYLLNLFYQNELDHAVARKWRSVSMCPKTLRDAQLAIHELRRELKRAVDLAHFAGFDAFELRDEARRKFIENGFGEQ